MNLLCYCKALYITVIRPIDLEVCYVDEYSCSENVCLLFLTFM